MIRTAAAIMTTVAVAGCAHSTPARAHHAPATRIERALALAERVWHPSCGALHVRFDDPRTSGTTVDATGWAWAGDCTIHLSNQASWRYYPPLCQVILHEAGHVAGRGHSTNPRSIMYPTSFLIRTAGTLNGRRVVHWTGVDRRCLG